MVRGMRAERARTAEIQQAFAKARSLIEQSRELREGYADLEYELQGFLYARTALYFTQTEHFYAASRYVSIRSRSRRCRGPLSQCRS